MFFEDAQIPKIRTKIRVIRMERNLMKNQKEPKASNTISSPSQGIVTYVIDDLFIIGINE